MGNDTLTGNIYQDILIGGTGTDTINASSGDDRIWGDGYSSIAWNGDNYGSTLDRTVGDADTIDAGDGTIGLMGELVMIPSMQAKGPMRFMVDWAVMP